MRRDRIRVLVKGFALGKGRDNSSMAQRKAALGFAKGRARGTPV